MSEEGTLFPEEMVDRTTRSRTVAAVLDRVVTAIRRERLPQSILLVGPEGLGRELAAQEIAVMLVDEASSAPFAQGPAADRVRRGLHPDVVVLRGEGARGLIKVDRIREVVEQAPGRPFEGQCRIWILDGVDRRLHAEGANAFLKVLEEPPAHVRFLLLAANPQNVLPTIRSRCARLMLPGIVGSLDGFEGGETPPEVALLVDRDPGTVEVFERMAKGVRSVIEGDVHSAVRLATICGRIDGGVEVLAAAAMETAAGEAGWSGAEACAGIAAELLRAEPAIRTLGLRAERQILSILLRWGAGRGGC